MDRKHIHSSVISSIGYDDVKHILEVKFLESGEIYHYFNVPKDEYKKLLELSEEDESVGTYFNTEFKSKFKRYHQIYQ